MIRPCLHLQRWIFFYHLDIKASDPPVSSWQGGSEKNTVWERDRFCCLLNSWMCVIPTWCLRVRNWVHWKETSPMNICLWSSYLTDPTSSFVFREPSEKLNLVCSFPMRIKGYGEKKKYMHCIVLSLDVQPKPYFPWNYTGWVVWINAWSTDHLHNSPSKGDNCCTFSRAASTGQGISGPKELYVTTNKLSV